MEQKLMPAAPFGKAMRHGYFAFEKAYTPLNHGSFGAFPTVVRDQQQEFQQQTEARPDTFIRYTYLELLKQSRSAVAPLLGVAADEVVFVPNATTGVNTILRNLMYSEGDVILHFNTIYGACKKTIESLCETAAVESVEIDIQYPLEDDEILQKFCETVKAIQKEKKVRVAIFDTVLTFPGVRFPWEALVRSCMKLEILSLVDGAHGIGHLDLTKLGEIGPDFFISNCYKWLYVPRGCAVLHVPFRNQHLIRTSIPTSWGYESGPRGGHVVATNPASGGTNAFVHLFNKVSTIDTTPYICVPRALEFREKVCGGEQRIRKYCEDLARAGGSRLAEILGTEVLENKSHSLQRCCFTNVRLPLKIDVNGAREEASVSMDEAPHIAKWMVNQMVEEFDTYIPTKVYGGAFWIRLSGQIYLEIDQFEWAGRMLQELCDRVARGEGRGNGQ